MAVTGANVGIGLETAVGVAGCGATTLLACRDRQKAEAAAGEVRRRSGNHDVHVVDLDLADLASVAACARSILEGWDRLDVLVNNAGGIWSDRQTTAQGFELTFGVNHLGHFLLTNLLRERLIASAPARLVNLTSVGHHGAVTGMHWDDLQAEHGYSAMGAYSQSKLANLLFTRALARRHDPTVLTANAAHPGPVRSGFGMDGDMTGLMARMNALVRPFEISPEAGARTSIKLAVDPDLAGRTGEYWAHGRRGFMSPAARRDDAAERLWRVSEELLDSVGFGLGG